MCYSTASPYVILYFNDTVQRQVLALPDTLAARYVFLTRRIVAHGPNLGPPHTKAFGAGLFELRLSGAEGIARVFFCTRTARQIVMLHVFVKKTSRTPRAEIEIARKRLREIRHEKP